MGNRNRSSSGAIATVVLALAFGASALGIAPATMLARAMETARGSTAGTESVRGSGSGATDSARGSAGGATAAAARDATDDRAKPRSSAGESGDGCPHYRSNPMCRPLPKHPHLSAHDRAWAALLFQPTRDYLPGFNAGVGLARSHPFSDRRDGSDPPLAHASRETMVPQVVACDRVPWGAWSCGRAHLDGATVDFPADTEPAGNTDHHLAWTDPARRGNFNCWLCVPPGPPHATIHIGTLGFCSWDGARRGDDRGTGTGCSGATATDIENTIGSITAADFARAERDREHGTFGHALSVAALCADPSFVYPATASDGKNTDASSACAGHLGAGDRPPEGTRIFLDRSDAEIDALALPQYNKAWLRTLDREHYGATIVDTNWQGAPGISAAYQRDDFSAQAREAGIVPSSYAAIPLALDTLELVRDVRFCASGDCR